MMTLTSNRGAADFPSHPWSHPPVIGGVASPPAADAEGKTAGLVAIPGNGPPVAQRAAGSLADDDINKSSALGWR